MYEITAQSTIREIKSLSGFRRFSQFLWFTGNQTGSGESKDDHTLEWYHQTYQTWGIESMLKGFRRLQSIVEEGIQTDYEIWSEEDVAAEPDRKDTRLFYFPGDAGKPFVLICAGGAYQVVCSFAEAFPLAARLNELGYNAFVLSYRIMESAHYPKPVDDMAQAIKFIQEHASQFHVAKEHYAVAGFSAGGHLAAEWGTENLGYKNYQLPKPGALFLAYAAIDKSLFMIETFSHHIGKLVLGVNFGPKELDAVNVPEHMGADYPPFFMWQCKDDPVLSGRDMDLMKEAAEKAGVPYELLTIEKGGHGLGLGLGSPAEGWLEQAVNFWEKH